jgi:nonribosomal peptide synthetase DhbF
MCDYCIPGLFDRQVRSRPNSIAVEMNERRLTYAELGFFADAIAQQLYSRGVVPGVKAGICMKRSPEMIAAALGVLRAGGTYVPLDPQFPDTRLAFMARQADVHVILTEEALCSRIPQTCGGMLLVDQLDLHESGQYSRTDRLLCATNEDDPAYVIFTSGSTGQPKGVIVPRRCVTALLDSTQPLFSFGPHDIWTLYHSFGFDFSVWEIWGCLLSGGKLVIVPEWMTIDFRALAWLLVQTEVTVLNLTPSALWRLCETVRNEPLPDFALRWLILGGERLDFTRLGQAIGSLGSNPPEIANMYGITEVTVHATFHRIENDEIGSHANIIGQPLPGMSIHLLDDTLNPVPMDTTGEIYVCGNGVAQGYAGRPDLTADRFLRDPFCDRGFRRMYRTGDLARRNVAGDYEFVGRRDTQVKVRGFRVEPDEIETVLASHPRVSECVIISRMNDSEELDLTACVVADPGFSEVALRKYARDLLPGFMIPAHILLVPQIPLTPNGKLDRPAIAELLERATTAGTASQSSPQERLGDVEAVITDAWKTVLGRNSVGLTDNFFDVGGHSLLVTELKSGLEQHFQRRIPVVAFFRYPTISTMAGYLRSRHPSSRAGDFASETNKEVFPDDL